MLTPQATNVAMVVAGTILPAWLISWSMQYLLRRWAVRWNFVDQPNARKDHTTATPLGGGIGIWAGTVLPLACYSVFGLLLVQHVIPSDWFPQLVQIHAAGFQTKLDSLWMILAAASIMLIVGVWDDRRGVNWKIRLALQTSVVAVCVFWQGWRLTAFINVPLITSCLSVVWIVALINSFNMLDNMDGLSGGVACIASSMLAAVILLPPAERLEEPQWFVGAFLLVLAGATLGFLLHNLPPAKIFMGDGGSYFIGFCLGVATLLATYTGYRSNTPHAILAPVFAMAVPFYDMLSVIVIRVQAGRSPFQADRNHLSHRLVELGATRWQAVLIIYLLTASCGLAALLLQRVDAVGAVVLSLLVACVLALIALLEWTARRQQQS